MPSYVAFVGMSAALILMPGPSQAVTLARTVAQGPRAGMLVALGLNTGTLVHVALAAFGLSAMLAASDLAYATVKYAGAGYLLYLAIRCIFASSHKDGQALFRAGSNFGQGLAVGTFNPKVGLFFMAFLPQFVDPGGLPAFVQFLIMGTTIAVLDTLYEFGLVWVVSRTKRDSQAILRRGQPAFALVFAAMAIHLALQQP